MALNYSLLPAFVSDTSTDSETRVSISVPSNAVTLTVPVQASDGVTFSTSKTTVSNNNILTLDSGVNNIKINPSTTVSTYSIFPADNAEMISYNNSFLMGQVSNNLSSRLFSRISCTFTANSTGKYYIECTAASKVFLTSFIMNSNAQPSSISVSTLLITPSVNGFVVLASDSALTNIIISTARIINSGRYNSINVTGSTVYGNRYYIGWVPSGFGSGVMGICSVRIN